MEYYQEFRNIEEAYKVISALKGKYTLQCKIFSDEIGVTNGIFEYYGIRKIYTILDKENKEIGYIEIFICKNSTFAYLNVSEKRNFITPIFNKSYLEYFS